MPFADARQVLFVQGGGAHVHDTWDNKLVDSLRRELGPGYEVRYPRMPNEGDPSFPAWRAALVHELDALRDGAVVVGHSIGGTILLYTLADHAPNAALGAVVVIATPFVGPGGWPSEDIEPYADLGARLPRGVPIVLYHGEADDAVPVPHVALYARVIPQARVRRLAGRDHQLGNNLAEVASEIRELGASRS